MIPVNFNSRANIKGFDELSYTNGKFAFKMVAIVGLPNINWMTHRLEVLGYNEKTNQYLVHVNNKTFLVPAANVVMQVVSVPVPEKIESDDIDDTDVMVGKKKKKKKMHSSK